MTLYIDTSSIVKLYVDEPAREDVRRQLTTATAIVTSEVAYPETRAALARRRRDRSLSRTAFATARRDFDAEWQRFVTIPASSPLCREAGDLAERYHLRGFDSIHLASFAEMLRSLEGADDVEFSSFDDRLNRAARRLARSIR
ncbi:MAG TPA: type II toxin-antitoxin system VapC family toxin [Vicinamibacterales bacterium]|nr:type II toxin-antitoxin system VapC family toxin [Vicinamibacterales bacterium]